LQADHGAERMVIEHAGAERGILFLLRGGEAQIAAEAATGRDGVVVRLQETCALVCAVPEAALHYVSADRESLSLEDASPATCCPKIVTCRSGAPDPSYVCHHAQSKLVGVLYLEN